MEIIVDGIIYEFQAQGGVSRIYTEILPRICDMSKDVQITLLTASSLEQPLPFHSRIHQIAMPSLHQIVPARWFPILEKDVRSLVLRNGPIQINRDTIWHSTYFTLPHRWPGKSVCTVPDMIHELYPSLFIRSEFKHFLEYKQECVKQANAIICISQSVVDDVRKFYDIPSEIPIRVIHLGCSRKFHILSEPCADYLPPTEKGFLLYVGGRYSYKNFYRFIRAYSVWSLGPDVDVVVVGQDWSSSEIEFLKELGLTERIYLLTHVTDDDLCHLYNLALAFIYPSLHEGFGLPLLESYELRLSNYCIKNCFHFGSGWRLCCLL